MSAVLSRAAGDIALRLLEQSQCTIVERTLIEQSEAAAVGLRKMGALVAHSTTRSVIIADERGERSVDVDWDAASSSYRYFDGIDGFVRVPAEALNILRLDLRWWLKWLVSHLELVGGGDPVELMGERAWDIGDLWLDPRRKVPVIFARQQRSLDDVLALNAALQARPGRAGGIVLTSSRATARQLPLPLNFQRHSIAQIVLPNGTHFALDRSTLIAGCNAPLTIGGISLSSDNRVLTLDREQLTFRGPGQQLILRKLVNAHQAGRRLRTSDVLAGVTANSFAKVFRGSPNWAKLSAVLRQENGMCWLEL
jgi:hypothetical protein